MFSAQVAANSLADPLQRSQAAQSIATSCGAEAFFILLPDPTVGSLRPAPGFPQTLPGGASWRSLLRRCADPGLFTTEVAYPHRDTLRPAQVYVHDDRTVFVLVGVTHYPRIRDLGDVSLLRALLRCELQALAEQGSTAAAREATERATGLATALERARVQLQANAEALQAALDESGRLNDALSLLNQSLEQRVSDEIAERMKAEESLRQAQKMEAIGQLTGGVAHDFNNLLTVIIGSLESQQRQLDAMPGTTDNQRLRRLRDMAFSGAERAAVLTARLLAFSRRQALRPQPVDVSRLIAGMKQFLRRTVGEHIALEVEATEDMPLAQVDPAELETALLNLAVNARDAMPTGGTLRISAGSAQLGQGHGEEQPDGVSPGHYVAVTITDTGIGMDQATLDHAFEPFFTTKEVGKGTGLGLSQVYGFVRQSGGHTRIDSKPGHGTSVSIFLPSLPRTSARGTAQQGSDTPATADGGNETILVVEDHDELRSYTLAALLELGYRVFTVSDGPSALQALRARPDVQLLFTDVVLPGGMNGRELAVAAQKMRPDLKVLFTTGYSRDEIVRNGRVQDGLVVLGKPFTFAQLAMKVRTVLDSGRDSVSSTPVTGQ